MAKNSNADRLKIELEIQKAIENSTKSINTYKDAQKTLVENAKLMAIAQEEINDLVAQGVALDDERITKRKLEIQQLKEINKELTSTKNALKAIGNDLLKTGKSLLPTMSGIKDAVLDVDDALRSTAAQIGLSGQSFKTFKGIAEGTRDTFTSLGFSLTDNVQMMKAFADETGRQNLMSAESANSLASTARILDMSAESVGQLAGQMEAFGLGALQSSETMLEIRDTAEGMGVNTGKVMKKFQQNLGLLNKLDFKGGMKGMAKMAAYSEKYKISMEAVAGVADKVFRPEGAIDAAANLQMLGGSLSQLGDPFQLMYQARYAPEELAKSLTSAAKQSAVFNEKTGEFEMNALEMDRLREAAQALGMDYTELVQTAKQSAKIDFMSKFLPSGMDEKDKEMLLGLANMKGGTAVVTLPDGTEKALNQLTETDKKLLLDKAKGRQELEDQAMSLKKEWTAIQNTMLSVGVGIFQPIADWLNGENGKAFIKGIKDLIIGIGKMVKSLFDLLGPTGSMIAGISLILLKKFGDLAFWFIKGRALRKGFDTGGVGGKATSALSQQSGPLTKSGKPDMRYNANKTQMGGQGGMDNMTKGMNTTDMIKGAAAMVILAGALWVFAKALQEFDKLENGWETLAMAGVSMVGLGLGLWALSKLPTSELIEGALAMAIMGAAFIPLAFGLSLLQGLTWDVLAMAGVALIGLTLAIIGLGAIMMSGFGAAAIVLGAAALAIMGVALMAFGAGLSMVVDPLARFLLSVSGITESVPMLLLLGPALLLTSVGVMALGASLMFLGAAMAMGGWIGLLALGATAIAITSVFDSIASAENGLKGISSSVDAINNIDMDKLNALKELASMMSIWGMFGAKPIEVRMTVDGDIELTGQGNKDTDWINDPAFVSNLKDLIIQTMEKDKSGGLH